MKDLDQLLAGGAKTAKFERVGDTITGIVTDVMVRQATEYGTGKPQTFDNGDPREQVVVVLKAENITPDDEDDDLHRSVYVKGWGPQRRALIEAVRAAKARVEVGDRFTATLVGTKPSDKGGFPAKVYEYRIQPMQGEADAQWAAGPAEVNTARLQAIKLIEAGLPTDAIARATGLDADEINSLSHDTPF